MRRRFSMRCVNGTSLAFAPESDNGINCERFAVRCMHTITVGSPTIFPKGSPIVVDSDGKIQEIGPEHEVPISSGCRVFVDGSVFVINWCDDPDVPMPPLPGPSNISIDLDGPKVAENLNRTKARYTSGVKSDFGKVRGELVPPDAEAWVARVAEYGAEKYEIDNWKKLSDQEGQRRLREAIRRHLDALRRGEVFDPETKMPHAAAIGVNAAFLLHFGFLSGEPGWDPFKLTPEQVQALRDAPALGKMAK